MADSITLTTELQGDSWSITGSVTPGGVLPAEIFVYKNTGTVTLGPYVGVCKLSELQRIQIWAGVAIPKFGNKFVRSDQAKITLPVSEDPSLVTFNIINTAKALKTEMLAASSSTTVYPI